MQTPDIDLHLALANALYTNTAIYKGVTIDRYFKKPVCGYMSSGPVPGLVFPNISQVNVHELSAWVKANLESQTRIYFGGWIDQETGAVHFDVSVNLINKDSAINYGKQYNQIAIWDVVNNCEIRL